MSGVLSYREALRGALRVRREGRERPDQLLANAATGIAGSLIAILVQAGSTGLGHREFVYIHIALAGAVVMLQRKQGQPEATSGVDANTAPAGLESHSHIAREQA